ncbi:hypothetical protein HQ520_09325 [bacterium]|nr:hypothetical protein [bacterium]
MLEERFRLLEEKVTSLLGELKRLRKENKAQSGEISSLREEADEAEKLRAEKDNLTGRVQELENDVASGEAKEEEMRERLRSIIEKIDALESIPEAD